MYMLQINNKDITLIFTNGIIIKNILTKLLKYHVRGYHLATAIIKSQARSISSGPATNI